MFVWWSAKARVHMEHNHVQRHTQHKHLKALFELRFLSLRPNYLETRKVLEVGFDNSTGAASKSQIKFILETGQEPYHSGRFSDNDS